MLKKILVAGALAGTVAYLLRDKIAEGFTALEERFLAWAAEDGTEDEPGDQYPSWKGTAPVPSEGEGYPVGRRGGDSGPASA